METFIFEKEFRTDAESLWKLLWDGRTYSLWTQYFNAGSQLRSDWKVGGRTLFLNSDGDGMVSTIETYDPPYTVVFKHLGTLKNGVEDTASREVMQWSGWQEKYFLQPEGDITRLRVEAHINKEHHDMMRESFEKGFEVLRQLAERS